MDAAKFLIGFNARMAANKAEQEERAKRKAEYLKNHPDRRKPREPNECKPVQEEKKS